VLADCSDSNCPRNFIAVAQRHAQCAADAGLLRARLCHAAGVRLQIANRDRLVLRDDLSGDSFSDGNCFDDFEDLRRQGDLRREIKQLIIAVEPVDRAGLGIKFCEHDMKNLLQNRFAVRVILQQAFNLFVQFIHDQPLGFCAAMAQTLPVDGIIAKQIFAASRLIFLESGRRGWF